MEKEGQKWEQEEVEEQEEEGTTVLVRKPRNENGSKTIDIAAVDVEEVSNGVSESNEHSELAADGAKSEESILEEEQKIEELDGVLENESEAINGEQNSENVVFYDKTEGIWKCRICSWGYRDGSFCADHIQNHKGLLHELMNVDTLNFESEGVESDSKNFGEKQIVKDPGDNKLDASSLEFITQNSSASAINNTYEGVPENDGFSNLKLQPSQTLFQESHTDHKSSKEIESAEVDLEDLEVAEFDVERVIQEQTTHDLYCPNCNSCITKRVILRKRKRQLRVSDEEVKRNKIERDSKLGTSSVQSTGNQIRCEGKVGDDDTQLEDHDRGPDIFRCLSCFSFFIPTRNGFKLFQKFGDKDGKENVPNEQAPTAEQAPTPKKNWFTSMFAPSKPVTALDQGSSIQTEVPKGEVGILTSPNLGNQSGQPSFSKRPHSPSHVMNNDNLEGTDSPVLSPQQKHPSNGEVTIGAEDRLDMRATDTVVTNGKTAEDTLSFSRQDGLKMLIPTNNGSLTVENSDEDQIPNQTMQSEGQMTQIHSTEVSQKVDNIPALTDTLVQQGKDAVITIDTQPEGLPQTLQDTITLTELQPANQTGVADRERAEAREELKIEVAKSIVYGGLAESITSLSVVSSAAGGGAATLNTLAVGVANLIGGFFIICHNLWELNSDNIEQVANQVSHGAPGQRDRYKELLGRRRNFIIHFIVAITSYLVFGSVAPAVYGLSFRQTDDKQLKLIVTAAASLVCITVLAIGRAYVRRPPEPCLKTVFTFVVSGFMVSGVSYAAGQLIERLLEKLGLFQSSSVPNLLLNEMITTGSERASL